MAKTVNQSIMPCTARINEKGHFEVGGCDAVELAQKHGTPLYVMDEASLRTSCQEYTQAFSKYSNSMMLFASKAFLTKAMCCLLNEEGFGLDAVSGGEIYTALKSNFNMSKIYFNGNNKTAEELELALDSGVGRITADNFYELGLLNKIAGEKGKKADILLRITPGIECHTHEYIQTGHLDSKFGFDLTQLDSAIELVLNKYTNLQLQGLHAHIGSQIFETRVYNDVVDIISQLFIDIKTKFGIELKEMNIGGGLGITYTDADKPPSIFEIADVIITALNRNISEKGLSAPKLIIEPGRSIVATAGVTLYTIGSSKQVPQGKKYVAIDGGMADNPRPSMYQAEYHAILGNKATLKADETVTIGGRYCESGDILIKNIQLPSPKTGDILCVFGTGAYNYSMSSNYNRVPKPACVLVQNGQSDVIIKRETYDDIVSMDVVPERLSCKSL